MVRALKYFHFITPATLLALAAPTMAQTIAASSQCNGANLAILCDGNSDAKLGRVACERTSLQITTPKGDVLLFPKPREFADPKDSNTATSVSCAQATRRYGHYFIVQYGGLPWGCEFCEWFYVYNLEGTQLTHSEPAILLDETLPEGHQAFANNEEYGDLVKTLGLQAGNASYVECERMTAQAQIQPNVSCWVKP